MSALLKVSSLKKSFGALKVTDDVSFHVEPGELLAIIGPNGAGKTTLIGQLSGQLAPDSGEVLYDGAAITRLDMAARVRRGLARSFQITTLLPSLTVLENVAIAVQARQGRSFRFFRAAARDRAVNEAAMAQIEALALGPVAGRTAGSLSHGEKRQLELAMALATGPRLLLLDEPLAGTGPHEAERLVAIIEGLKRQLAIVLIEHDMDAVFRLADRVAVLVYGRIIASGPPAAVREDARVRAAYLGEEG